MEQQKQDIDNKKEFVSGGTGYVPEFVMKKSGKIILYPVTKAELQTIKDSNNGNIALNIFCLSISACLSFFIAYLTCEFDTELKRLIFLFVSILLAIICIGFFVSFMLSHRKSNELYKEIINREDSAQY